MSLHIRTLNTSKCHLGKKISELIKASINETIMTHVHLRLVNDSKYLFINININKMNVHYCAVFPVVMKNNVKLCFSPRRCEEG